MTATAPQIGFDRFIELDWSATALRVRGFIRTAGDHRPNRCDSLWPGREEENPDGAQPALA
jgi:hypothetical protein